jgi:hypothetical protein
MLFHLKASPNSKVRIPLITYENYRPTNMPCTPYTWFAEQRVKPPDRLAMDRGEDPRSEDLARLSAHALIRHRTEQGLARYAAHESKK